MHTASSLHPLRITMSTDRIRTTITITPEAHEVFSRMAETAGLSLGRCIGDWLTDTLDGAQFVSLKMAEARKAPSVVMREMHAMALGLVDETNRTMAEMREKPAGRPSEVGGVPPTRPAGRPTRVSPPSSNTGGKVPRGNPKGGQSVPGGRR